jgi:hypothetical protein
MFLGNHNYLHAVKKACHQGSSWIFKIRSFWFWLRQARENKIPLSFKRLLNLLPVGVLPIFENGEIATMTHVGVGDTVKGTGTFMQYVTIKFEDGSTIIIKSQGTVGGYSAGGSGGWTSEIIKGTGRFEGIKGTQAAKAKYLPVEKGEAGPRGYGEGTITFNLPTK